MRAAAHAQPRLNCQRSRRPSTWSSSTSIACAQSTRSAGRLRTARTSNCRARPPSAAPRFRRACTSAGSATVRATIASARTMSAAMTHPAARGPVAVTGHDRTSRVRRCLLEASRRQAIEMPARTTERRPILPLRLEQTTIAKPHQDRIERTRPQTDLHPQLIAIPPRRRIPGQCIEHLHGLRRGATRANRHLFNSIYVEIIVKYASVTRSRGVEALHAAPQLGQPSRLLVRHLQADALREVEGARIMGGQRA